MMRKFKSRNKAVVQQKCLQVIQTAKNDDVEVQKTTDISIEKCGNKTYVVEETVIETKRAVKEKEARAAVKKILRKKAKQTAAAAKKLSNGEKRGTTAAVVVSDEKAKEATATDENVLNAVDEISNMSLAEKKRLKKKAKRNRYKQNKQNKNADKLKELVKSSKDSDSGPADTIKDRTADIKESNNENMSEKPGNSQINMNQPENDSKEQNLRKCFHCGAVEKVFRAYKKCGLCFSRQWTLARFYCSNECQGNAWKERHCEEHNICADSTDTASE